MPTLYDAFISYSRKDSKTFARKLNDGLTKHGFKVWFDQNDMPDAVYFQNHIKEAIKKSHNFIFIISPLAVQSSYCYQEIDEAVKLNKRIIPIRYLETDWGQMQKFKVKKLNQCFCRQDKLDNGEIDFDNNCITPIVTVLRRQQQQVEQHTRLLVKAADWQPLKPRSSLLSYEERQEAVPWLLQTASESEPTDLQCEYICESTINANNLLTQAFISYAGPDKTFMVKLRQTLRRHHITVWTDKNDSQINELFQHNDTTQQELNERIEEADNFIYVVSTDTESSTVCQQQLKYASSLNKRIMALTIAETEWAPPSTIAMSLIDFKQHAEHYSDCANQLLSQLRQDADYYEQHKLLLVKALKWQRQKYNSSLLLRGRNLEKFQAWFEMAQSHSTHPPLQQQQQFIRESRNQLPEATLDIFISYSQTDADFARKLNEAFQSRGKTTWFDQESILVGDDFEAEIKRGIEQCNDFLFIISPSSIGSPYCEKEANYAQSLNKRMTSILHRPVAEDKLPAALKNNQWIDFNPPKKFYTHFNELSRTLEIDREYKRSHTKWMLRALEWFEQDKSADALLRGNDFAAAKAWLSEAKQKPLTLNQLQLEFIEESQIAIALAEEEEQRKVDEMVNSRTAELSQQLSEECRKTTRLQNLLIAMGGFALIILLAIYWYAEKQQQIARQAQTDTNEQQQIARQAEQQATQTQNKAEVCEKTVQKVQAQLKACQQPVAQTEEVLPTSPASNNDGQPENFRDRLSNGTEGPEMVWIPAGRFLMGDIQGEGDKNEQPLHEVFVERVAIARYEVTVGEFRRFVEDTGYQTEAEKQGSCFSLEFFRRLDDANWRNPGFSQTESHPVVCVSWNDAMAYTEWLTQQTGHQYRLPTEAEWEYAARAGTETSRYWGNDPDEGCRYANVYDKTSTEQNSFPWQSHNCTDGYAQTAPVGRFEPNAFGLFDMIGNVWEWTCSEYHNRYAGQEQHCAKYAGRFVLRGGAWSSGASRTRSAYRDYIDPTDRGSFYGFRPARIQ